MEAKSSRKIGKYEIVGKVAQGGMGALYKARHPTLDRVVLLKKLTLRGGAQFIERFRREARLMMDFKHEQIVHVYDHFKEGSSYYIVEEFVDGLSLDALIRRDRYLSNEAAMLILYEVCQALRYAHDKQVVHRDIKPGNILLSHRGEVKLADFGIATSLEESEDGLTRDGMMLGTPSYVPPEQIDDAKSVDKRADIYSLGVVLYEMLTGKTPFPGTFSAETIALIHRGRYPSPRRFNPRISRILRRVIRRAMKRRRRRRFQDVRAIIRILERRIRRRDPAALRQAVRNVLQGKDIREIFRRRRSALGAVLGALCALSLLAAGGAYVYRQGYYHEFIATQSYGALSASVEVPREYKDPDELFIKPVLYRERDSELVRLDAVEFRFRENARRGSKTAYVLESQRLYLEAGRYRLKVNLEGQLHWESFFLMPRDVQRRLLSTADGQRIALRVETGRSLPLQLRYTVFDADSGAELTEAAELFVYLGSAWQRWGRELAESLSSGQSYRFRFEAQGYYPQTYGLVIQAFQTQLRLEARLVPRPGVLALRSNAAGLSVLLNGSDHYFTGGRDRQYRPLEPLGTGVREMSLSPGSYQLTVRRDAALSRTLSLRIEPDHRVAVTATLDFGGDRRGKPVGEPGGRRLTLALEE
jgi:tRNA A-37 threonylcarbamoyl transferase component Bud32